MIYPERPTATPMMDHFIFILAVAIDLSSPADIRYWIPEIINAPTAKIEKMISNHLKKLVRISETVPLGSPVSQGITMPLPEEHPDEEPFDEDGELVLLPVLCAAVLLFEPEKDAPLGVTHVVKLVAPAFCSF